MRVGAVTVRWAGIVGLGIGSRERLVVGVPRLLVVVRHTVLIALIVTVLWFLVSTSTADTAAAHVIPTGRVVVISVWLLVRVIPLLRAVRHRLHALTTSSCVVCAVRILLKHLATKNKKRKGSTTSQALLTHRTDVNYVKRMTGHTHTQKKIKSLQNELQKRKREGKDLK